MDDPTCIDIIAKPKDGRKNGLDLVIVDAGTIEESEARYAALLAKLRAYVAYVLSDDFAAEHPECTPGDVQIQVVHRTPPTEKMLQIQAITPRGDPSKTIAVRFVKGPEF